MNRRCVAELYRIMYIAGGWLDAAAGTAVLHPQPADASRWARARRFSSATRSRVGASMIESSPRLRSARQASNRLSVSVATTDKMITVIEPVTGEVLVEHQPGGTG